MNKYDLMLEGKIINVKNIKFSNGDFDHAWNTGRPCLVLYTDEEFEYILPISHSISKKYIKEYFNINNDCVLEFYNQRYKENILIRRTKLDSKNIKQISGYINIRYIYKIPLAYRDEIGKLKYESYKKIINKLKIFHHTNTLKETLEKAVVK